MTGQQVTVPKGWFSRTGRNRDLEANCIEVEITNFSLTLVYQADILAEADFGSYTHLWVGGRKKKINPTVEYVGRGDRLTATWQGALEYTTSAE